MEKEKSLDEIKTRIKELDQMGYDRYLEADLCLLKGSPLETLHQLLDEAFQYYEEETRLILEIGQDPEDLADNLCDIADLCECANYAPKAKMCYETQLRILDKLIEQNTSITKNTEQKALVHGSLGDVLAQEGDVKAAIQYLNTKIKLLTKLSDDENDISYDLEIGKEFSVMSELVHDTDQTTSLEYLEMAMEQYIGQLDDNTKNPDFLRDMFFVFSKAVPLYFETGNGEKAMSTRLIVLNIIDAFIKLIEEDESNTISLPEEFGEFLGCSS